MKSQHTEGPYHVSDPECCNEVIDSKGRTIAVVEEWDSEGRGNVTLLAASDDLLAACERASGGYSKMIHLLDRIMPEWRRAYDFVEGKNLIDEAIAKAKGEQP